MFPLRDRNPTQRFPIVTILLIVVNVGVFFILQPASGDPEEVSFTFEYAAIPCELTTGEALSAEEVAPLLATGESEACAPEAEGPPLFPDKPVWLAVVFSMFLHGGWLHLGGNMLFLWVFGNNIEDHLGILRYIAFYLIAGAVATAAHVALQPDSTIPLIGASGAVAGVMGAYLVWFPNARVLTAFVVILIFLREIPAKWLLGFWFVSQFFISPNSGVAWAAHVGGFVIGVLVGALVRASGGLRKVAWRSDYAGTY